MGTYLGDIECVHYPDSAHSRVDIDESKKSIELDAELTARILDQQSACQDLFV